MAEFTVQADTTLWHEVPGESEADRFRVERTEGLSGDARATAESAANYALSVRSDAGITLLLQEPEAGLYAVASFSIFQDRTAPTTASQALQIVTDGEVGQWEPTVVPVEFGEVRGYRVSELLASPGGAEQESDLTVFGFTQTTYVLSVGERLAVVALSPAPVPAAGIALLLVEPIIATWSVGQ